MDIGFCNSTYQARSRAVNAQECVNWYPEIYAVNEEAKAQIVLYPTPGLSLFATLPNNQPVRGSYVTSSGRMFHVAGNTLYEVTVTGKVIQRATFDGPRKVSPVIFSDNGTGLDTPIYLTDPVTNVSVDTGVLRGLGMILVDGFDGYMYNLVTNTIKKITGGFIPNIPVEGAFPICTHVTFIDGRFIVNERNTQKFWWSEAYDGFNWNPLNFAQAEGSPDNLLALITINNELWLFGAQSTEVWYDTGAQDATFQRIHGAFFNNGTIAPYSVATNGSNVFWLGSSAQGHGQVWTATNYQPQKISTQSIDYIIESLPNIQDAQGFCYTQGGHNFYILNFSQGNRTLVYDLTTGLWHERGSWNADAGIMEKYRLSTMIFFNGENYAGDSKNGNIYKIDYNTFTENGDMVRRVRVGSHIHSERKRLYFNNVEVDFERGVGEGNPGSAVEQGIDPQAMLQFSNDGGYTWSNELWMSLGQVGAYMQRIKWARLGKSRDRMFKLTVTDPNKVVLIAANADITAER